MQSELDGFAAFYNEKHQGHKIEWNHALGMVNLRARFAAGQKELSVSLYQAVVLLLFNDIPEIPFSEVKLHTGIGASRRPCVTALCIYAYFLTSTMLFSFFLLMLSWSFRGRGVAAHASKLGVREEKGAQKTSSWKRCERRRRVRVQQCV